MAGLAGAAVPVALMSRLGLADATWAMPVLLCATGMLFGFSVAPAQTAALAMMSPEQTGQALTLFNVQRQVGQALGVAVFATVLAATRPVPSDLGGYRLAFLAAAVTITSRVSDADAVATMPGAAEPDSAVAGAEAVG